MRLTPHSLFVTALAFSVVIADVTAQPQQQDPEPINESCPYLVRAYVQPDTGYDPPAASIADRPGLVARLNDPNTPFQTIQRAIDACQLGVEDLYINQNATAAQGIVYCMPGVYGPGGSGSSVDAMPLIIRDRVSVQGQGARRTIIRGGSDAQSWIYWPDTPSCDPFGNVFFGEILVDFGFASEFAPNVFFDGLPWANEGPTEEMVDGFTFQGGDVQLRFSSEDSVRGRVSNCIFDMRHQDPDLGSLDGPYMGIEISQRWDLSIEDYHETRVNILNNTFIMGQHSEVNPLAARPESVAIIEVNQPICGPFGDPDPTHRGFGEPSIQNNLIRDLPNAPRTALLGIDSSDTSAVVGTQPGPTNAFHSAHVGGTNGFFFSAITGSTPTPKVNLALVDPGFVGEVLASALPTFANYRDFRIMPDSPLVDQGTGLATVGGDKIIIATNQTSYVRPNCDELRSFDNDMEIHGNRRRAVEIDIGADETNLLIMAGSYTNDSNSHHDLCGPINTSVVVRAPARRIMIFPVAFAGSACVIHGTEVAQTLVVPPAPAGLTYPGWIRPPGALAMTSLWITSPPFYRTQYISYSDAGTTPTPWTAGLVASSLVNPVSGVTHTFAIRILSDNEPASTYFNTQAEISNLGTTYHSNLQAEYR